MASSLLLLLNESPDVGEPPVGIIQPSDEIIAGRTARSSKTALRSKKVPYVHGSHTFALPEWLGGNAKVESISFARGDLKARYVRSSSGTLGQFRPISTSIQSPNVPSVKLLVKERIGETIYSRYSHMDIDVRTQNCGHVSDPNNWVMIKRLCHCVVTDMDTDGETIMSSDDDGETMINLNLKTANEPVIVRGIYSKQINLHAEARFANYNYEPVIAPTPNCGYIIPAITDGVYADYHMAYGNDLTALVGGTVLLPYHPIAVSSNDNIVVVVLSNGSVWWSNDYGKTFATSDITAGALTVEIFSYSNVLVGLVDDVKRSTDGGRTFESVDPYDAVTGNVVAIAFADMSTVYVLDSNGNVSLSEDDGETFIKVASTDLLTPTDMISMDEMLIAAGYDVDGIPVIIGSEDGGYTWNLLTRFQGIDVAGVGVYGNRIKLSSCGCGVVVAAVTYHDGTNIRSELYRNVNWGMVGCWEMLWSDYKPAVTPNGLMFLTDVACSCVNEVLAVGMIIGADPLYFGIQLTSME